VLQLKTERETQLTLDSLVHNRICKVTAGRNLYSDRKQSETQLIHCRYLKSDSGTQLVHPDLPHVVTKLRTSGGIRLLPHDFNACTGKLDIIIIKQNTLHTFQWITPQKFLQNHNSRTIEINVSSTSLHYTHACIITRLNRTNMNYI
jgi:hypothetical protein